MSEREPDDELTLKNRLAALEQRVAVIEAKPPPDTDVELEARVDALEASDLTQDQRLVVIEDAVSALEERVYALESGIPPEVEVPVEDIAVELHLPEGTLVFLQSEATSLGDYLGEFVQQHCLIRRQGAWTVFFRPDVDGLRLEVVVEYGGYDFNVSPPAPRIVSSWAAFDRQPDALEQPPQQPDDDPSMPSPEPRSWLRLPRQPAPEQHSAVHILTPYTATIRIGDEVLAMVEVPKQYWLTRWRWCSAPRQVVRSHDDLVAMKAILPLDENALWNNPTDKVLTNAVWSGPMGTGGLTTAMGTTGDRPEIGPITDLQGSYLLRQNPEALSGMLAQAEAVGSFPFWLRQNDGNLMHAIDYAYQGLLYTADATRYPKLYPAAPASSDLQFFRLDTAHHPAVAYVPWLLTDDPYFLEGCQAQAIFAAHEANYHQLNQQLPGLANLSQKRGWCWGCRDILRMAVMAPENPPGWLQPRAMFQQMAEHNRVYVQRQMDNPATLCTVFHVFAAAPAITCWEEGYGLASFGWLRWTRAMPEWDAAVDWLAGTLLGLSAVTQGGWDRRWPAPYRKYFAGETSWAQLWNNYLVDMAAAGTPITMGMEDKIYQNRADNPAAVNSSPHYQEVMLGALTALAVGGVPNAREHALWMREKMPPVTATFNNWPSSFRYAYRG